MALQDLILRSESHSPLTTKGSELTYAELDGNFIELYDYLSAMNSGSGIAPYDNGTTYSGTEYVSYNGNIYVHISATSTTGVLPDSDITKWALTSIGALAHQQNKDSYLAFGSASQVSAVDLYDILNNQTINITYANFLTAKNGALLKPNRLYCITNVNSFLDTGVYTNSQIKLYIRTISNSQYSAKGFISFVAPKYDSFSVYDYTYAYLVGDKVGYGLFVYECTNATSNGDSPDNDVANWTIKSYLSFPAFYTTKYFDVEWNDVGGTIYVNKVIDNFNNTFGANDFGNGNIASFQQIGNNDIDTTSWWNNICGFVNGVYGNKLINQSHIYSKGGYNPNAITNNFLNKSMIGCDEFINGDISNVHLTKTQIVIPNGDFVGTMTNLKIDFANVTGISLDANASVSGYMNEKGSNITAQLDITGTGGLVDLDSLLNYADIYGVFEMECNGDMIDYLLKANYYCPIIIKPITAHQNLTLKIYSLSGATNNNCVSSDYSGNIDLYTDTNDYAVLEKINIGGIDLWNVTYINKIA